jgi:hypothetical protein
MNYYSTLTKGTFISNLLILIGAGHGIAPIIFFEAISLLNFNDFDKSFSLSGDYESTLFAAAVLSLIGQLLLFVASLKGMNGLKVIAVMILWIGFIYLVHTTFKGNDNVAGLSFVTGIPFLVFSIILFVKIFRDKFIYGKFDVEIEQDEQLPQ